MYRSFLAGLLVILVCQHKFEVNGLDNGLALTPPMGWMSWQRYRCIIDCVSYPDECISERLFKNAADLLVSGGYKDAGYEYVIIDDCWSELERDPATQRLVADRKRFPSGIKALADYIHKKGLKFGIYGDYGTFTCAGYPGSIDHMKLDTTTFAEWGVDYVKLDGCNSDTASMNDGYPAFGNFLNKTGRPMVYSCSWPVYQEIIGIMPDYEALKKYCNLWRNWYDVQDSYQSVRLITDYFGENQSRIAPHAGPGHWNDPDMLLIGNFGLSLEQSKTQMAIWAILASPLIMSNDLKNVRPEYRQILVNKKVIAVNQDVLGIQGLRQAVVSNIEIWVKPVTPVVQGNPSYAIAWSSKRDDGAPYTISTLLTDHGLLKNVTYYVTDLFDTSSRPFYVSSKNYTLRVPPSGTVFLKFEPKPQKTY